MIKGPKVVVVLIMTMVTQLQANTAFVKDSVWMEGLSWVGKTDRRVQLVRHGLTLQIILNLPTSLFPPKNPDSGGHRGTKSRDTVSAFKKHAHLELWAWKLGEPSPALASFCR